MSAREELYAALMKGKYHSPDNSEKASYLIDSLLHEEAEKIREKKKGDEPLFPEEDPFMFGYGSGLDDGADLIDPYVKESK